ncbi:hypothetical protein NLJ89_g12115 [Agrocybe chaxingu]|uniref:Uncharacterized protein n=1 Tax=Agrocybe chaxingu TaxID=84603 RepID=A0A9W8MQJ1_9AGAR|nr:hypothetical protein NLJ89_g12115 [Agrocybe chaxingu]
MDVLIFAESDSDRISPAWANIRPIDANYVGSVEGIRDLYGGVVLAWSMTKWMCVRNAHSSFLLVPFHGTVLIDLHLPCPTLQAREFRQHMCHLHASLPSSHIHLAPKTDEDVLSITPSGVSEEWK